MSNAIAAATREMLWARLYSQLAAMEVLGVCRQGPGLNARGDRILKWLRRRATKATA